MAGFFREHFEKPYKRSSGWSKLRKLFIKAFPTCACCGRKKGLQVHHILPFALYPHLEMKWHNLITLCGDCHIIVGHLRNYKSYNIDVVEDAAYMLDKIEDRP